MKCHVYRSAVRDGLYVYIAAPDSEPTLDTSEADSVPESEAADTALLATLPDPVRRQLGRAERAMTLELDPSRPLGTENVREVIANLGRQGFHIQMPRDIETLVSTIADAAVNAASRRSRPPSD